MTVHLVGPGDIAGMHAQQVIRTEPRQLTTDFEPNYLAAVDFYDEDFPCAIRRWPWTARRTACRRGWRWLSLKTTSFNGYRRPARRCPPST